MLLVNVEYQKHLQGEVEGLTSQGFFQVQNRLLLSWVYLIQNTAINYWGVHGSPYNKCSVSAPLSAISEQSYSHVQNGTTACRL